MMLAYLVDKLGRTVALVGDDGVLKWQSDDPKMVKNADFFVPLDSIPESGGNPAAWAIQALARWMPAQTTCVVGENVTPAAKSYGETIGKKA